MGKRIVKKFGKIRMIQDRQGTSKARLKTIAGNGKIMGAIKHYRIIKEGKKWSLYIR